MADSSSGRVAETKRHSFLVGFFIRLVKEKPLGMVGGIITLLLLLTGIFADFIAPYGMNETRVVDMLSAPSAQYWLGTDNLGRDILSRVIFGARISVIAGLAGSIWATTVSLIIGILSGYIGGKFDLIVQRFVDAWMCLPSLILMMVIITIIGPGLWQLIICMGLTFGVTGSRIIRSAVIAIKENVYVEAAVAIGCPTGIEAEMLYLEEGPRSQHNNLAQGHRGKQQESSALPSPGHTHIALWMRQEGLPPG